jgi:hypothetical protein
MGKRIVKSDLLEQIQLERVKLEETLAGLSKKQMTTRGVTDTGWAVKDVLTHLIAWEQMCLNWYKAGLRGETPALPAPGMTWRDLPKLNDQIFKKNRRRSLNDVLAEFQSSHQQILKTVKAMPEADLTELGRYAWTGQKWTVGNFIAASTSSHYRWARTLIRKWAKRNGMVLASKNA